MTKEFNARSSASLEARLETWLKNVGWKTFPFGQPDNPLDPALQAEDERQGASGSELLQRYFVHDVILSETIRDDRLSGYQRLLSKEHTLLFGGPGQGKSASRFVVGLEATSDGNLVVDCTGRLKDYPDVDQLAEAVEKLILKTVPKPKLRAHKSSQNSHVACLKKTLARLCGAGTTRPARFQSVLLIAEFRSAREVNLIETLLDLVAQDIPDFWLKLFLASGLRNAIEKSQAIQTGSIKVDILSILWSSKHLGDLIRERVRTVSEDNALQLQSLVTDLRQFEDFDTTVIDDAMRSPAMPRTLIHLIHETVIAHITDNSSDNFGLTKHNYKIARENLLFNRNEASPPPPFIPSKFRALLVGINQYEQHEKIRLLKYAVADIQSMADLLGTNGYALHKLVDDLNEMAPTRGNILEYLTEMAEGAEKNEMLLFYFCGHGEIRGNQCYLLPQDARLRVYDYNGIAVNQTLAILKASSASIKVIILDACYSAPPDNSRDVTVSPERFTKLLRDAAEGIVILSAAQESAYESDDKKHGIFTFYLLEALNGKADFVGNGLITVTNAFRYVVKAIDDWQAKRLNRQKPTLDMKTTDGDIVLLRYKTEK
jgi:hypothetical protein